MRQTLTAPAALVGRATSGALSTLGDSTAWRTCSPSIGETFTKPLRVIFDPWNRSARLRLISSDIIRSWNVIPLRRPGFRDRTTG